MVGETMSGIGAPPLFAMFTSPYAWAIVILLGFVLFGKKFARFIGIPEWATFKIGERKYDLPMIILVSVGIGFILGRLAWVPNSAAPSKTVESSESAGFPVSRVVSGNSFQAKYENKTQTFVLAGVTTPEIGTDSYETATEALRKLLSTEPVTLEFAENGRDKHGRYSVTAYANGVNVNQEMIRHLRGSE